MITPAGEVENFRIKGNLMPKENYRRIVKGYEPREPASFLEKLFYMFWSLICALRVIAIRIKLR